LTRPPRARLARLASADGCPLASAACAENLASKKEELRTITSADQALQQSARHTLAASRGGLARRNPYPRKPCGPQHTSRLITRTRMSPLGHPPPDFRARDASSQATKLRTRSWNSCGRSSTR